MNIPKLERSVSPIPEAGSIISGIFARLEREGVQYCVMHGYEDLTSTADSDIDCIIDHRTSLVDLIRYVEQSDLTLLQVFQHESTCHYLVFYSAAADLFLHLDISTDYRRNGRQFFTGEEILAARHVHNDVWKPSPAHEFGYYLVKKVAKGSLERVHTDTLSRLYDLDPQGCTEQIGRFWPAESARILQEAARSNSWQLVRDRQERLRHTLIRPSGRRIRREWIQYMVPELLRRFRRFKEPTGAHVVLLGPDGVGKSSVVQRVLQDMTPAFRHVAGHHLLPGLVRRKPVYSSSTDPHAIPARSLPLSLLKSAYWLAEYSLGYLLRIRPKLVRSTFVLFDRYLPDVAVDPKRYRYAGPSSLVLLMYRLVPHPDLIILLDAPPDVIQRRKREVTIDETTRQRDSYRSLVRSMTNGHIVNADQPIEDVVADVNQLIIEFLARRTSQRLGMVHR
jgi:hypothetical protein